MRLALYGNFEKKGKYLLQLQLFLNLYCIFNNVNVVTINIHVIYTYSEIL